MTKVRTDLQFYGDRREDWAPYRPSLPESIATHAQRISASRFLDSDVTEVSQLTDRVDHARENNELVVLLVDSWITKLADHRSALATMDSRDEPALAILAPVSETDRETSRHRGELRSGLRSVLQRSLARKDQRLRIEIDDTRSFEIDLVTALEEAQNRIFQHGRIFRAPVARAPFGRPILQGP
jgi:FxsC-like protein